MKPVTAQGLRTGLRCLLGLLLLWAAVSKLANPIEFLGAIYAYELPLPKSLVQFAAVVLPWIELLCGLLLLANVWPESALACTAALMFVFVLATGQAWMRDLQIACGCFDLKIFGLRDNYPGLTQFLESPAFAFFRNIALTSAAGFLFWKQLDEVKEGGAAVMAKA